MHIPRRRFHSFLLVALAAVLAACGGPTGPAVPNASASTPNAAARGDSVTITGSGFGTTPGSVTIGGVNATTTDWTDTSITATVPAGATNAWHDVSVTTAGGSDSLTDALFVGVEFDGSGPDLQAFLDAQEPGTAVLLQATTYDLSAQTVPFVIDNVELHGRGAGETFITQPGVPQTAVFAEFGETTALFDLSMDIGMFMYMHGTLRDTVTPWASSSLDPSFTDGDAAVGSVWLDAVLDAAQLQPAAASPGRLVFDGVTFTETVPSAWGFAIATLPTVELEVRDSVFDLPTGSVGLYSSGDVQIESSTFDVAVVMTMTPYGRVTIVDSDVATVSGGLFAAQTGFMVDASTITVEDGDLNVMGAAAMMMGGSSIPAGGVIEFRNSTIEVLDGDLLDASNNGSLSLITLYAPIRLIDNVLIRTHDSTALVVQESELGEGDIDIIGNVDVRVGVSEAESAAGARPAVFVATTNSPSGSWRNRVTVEGNTITATADVQFVPADLADMHVKDNVITSGGVGPTGAVIMAVTGEGELEVTGNDFTFTSVVTIQAANLAGGTLVLAGNSFTSVTETSGIVTVLGVDGSCSFTDNVAVLDDASDANAKGFGTVCSSAVPGSTFTVSGNTLTATGSPSSGVTSFSNGVEQFTFADNELSIDNTFTVSSSAPDAVVAGNTAAMGSAPVMVLGGATASFTVSGNAITQRSPTGSGLNVSAMASATVTNNTFTGVGAPGAGATAFSAQTGTGPMELTVTGNTFTNYSNALHLTDAAGAAHGYTAAINGNVFDFVIDAAPKVATLTNIKDTIDATDNQWGSNTDHVTVKGYVTEAGDTGVQGGDIDVNPVTQP